MLNHKHYTYRVIWSEEDGEYVGLCAEFPGLSHLDEDQVAALSGIVDLVGEVIGGMVTNGEAVPQSIQGTI